MTGISSMMASFTPEYSAPIGPTVSGAPLPSDVLSTLSSNLNLGSMALDLFAGGTKAYGDMAAASQKSQALNFQAQDQLLQAKQETLKGQQDSNQIMDNMVQVIAAQRLAFAGNGMDVGFGTPVATEANTTKLAENQLSVTRANAQIASLSRRRQASALLQEGANTISSAQYTAAADIGKGVISALGSNAEIVQRGLARG